MTSLAGLHNRNVVRCTDADRRPFVLPDRTITSLHTLFATENFHKIGHACPLRFKKRCLEVFKIASK